MALPTLQLPIYANNDQQTRPRPMLPIPQPYLTQDQQQDAFPGNIKKFCLPNVALFAIVEMILSCAILLFGIVCEILASKMGPDSGHPGYWIAGTEIWAPLFGVITAALGLGVKTGLGVDKTRLLVSHFVMSIISSMAYSVLFILSAMTIHALANWNYNITAPISADGAGVTRSDPADAIIGIRSFILLITFMNILANMVSTALICKQWGNDVNKGGNGLFCVHPKGNNVGRNNSEPADQVVTSQMIPPKVISARVIQPQLTPGQVVPVQSLSGQVIAAQSTTGQMIPVPMPQVIYYQPAFH